MGEIDYTYLDTIDIPKISEATKEYLDRSIEPDEVSLALKQQHNGKTPGTDGIPPEFIKFFWSTLKDFYVKMIQEIVEVGKLSLSA